MTFQTAITLLAACSLWCGHPCAAIPIEIEIPAAAIKPTASSTYQAGQGVQHLIDGSGLNGATHDNNDYAGTMWHTDLNPAASDIAGVHAAAWVRFDFPQPQSFEKMLIWNHNQAGKTDRGFRKTKILGTTDGGTWTALAELELPRANGTVGTASPVKVAAKGPWKSVVIAAENNWGGDVYGMSEVRFVSTKEVAEGEIPFPDTMECVPQPAYRHRPDGKAGREVTVQFKGAKLTGPAQVEVTVEGKTETTIFASVPGGTASCPVLLPPEVGVEKEAQVTLTLRQGTRELKQTITVPPMRHWTVYLYNHAHVDIGYTNTHKNVERLHKTNIIEGVKLAEETKDYPPGSRYRWNPEVTWPLERLWLSMPELREKMLNAIRAGLLCVDAAYVNINTSICSDEELFHLFRFSREMQRLSGVPMDTFQQFDIPGISWGLVPVMAQEGVRYVISWPNSDRAGHARGYGISQKPFWWVGPDGKSKVLFLQPGGYANSGSMGKGGSTGRPWFGQRDADRVPPVIKTGGANVNFTPQVAALEKANHPYDFIVMSWTLWDNCPLDADIPDAVRAWNEQYAFPRIVIAGGHEIMSEIERKYGDALPVISGDYTEYWTDGLGTAARLTGINRVAKERLTQAETLWTLLRPGKPAPRAEFDEAWRVIAMGSEHTWCFENPAEPYFQEAIWKSKQDYFRQADDRSQMLLDDALAPATDGSKGALGPAEGPAAGGIAVLNTQSWAHGGLITLHPSESRRGDRVTDEQGRDVPAQRLSTGELAFLASEVPAFGSRHYRVAKGASPLPAGCRVNGATMENEHLRVSLDPLTGNITNLIHRVGGRNFADPGVNGGLNAFRWIPANRNEPQADTNIVLRVVENGPLVVELRVDSKATGCRSVSRSVRVIAGQPWVEIHNIVDKLPLEAKDGVHFGFGFNLPGARTRVDIPWGVMEVEKDQWPQANRNWFALQRWLDVSNDEAGVTWCSLDAALFEYGGMSANIATGWGGRGPWLTKLEPSSTIYSWVMNNHWHTNFPLTQDGPVSFRYRLLPHGPYDAAAANRFGLEQTQPLVHVAANYDPNLVAPVAVDNPRVVVTILKPTEDGRAAIVRLRSLSDKPENVALRSPAGQPKAVHLCVREEIPGDAVGESISLPPLGLATLRIEWK